MDQAELSELIAKTALLMEQFDRRCAELAQRQATSIAALERAGTMLPDVAQRSVEASLRQLVDTAASRVADGMAQPVASTAQRLAMQTQAFEQAARRLAEQVERVERAQRRLVWKVGAGALATLGFVVLGGALLLRHYDAAIAENRLHADLVRAYNAADVRLCGKRLCANVDPRAATAGGYRLVRPRPADSR